MQARNWPAAHRCASNARLVRRWHGRRGLSSGSLRGSGTAIRLAHRGRAAHERPACGADVTFLFSYRATGVKPRGRQGRRGERHGVTNSTIPPAEARVHQRRRQLAKKAQFISSHYQVLVLAREIIMSYWRLEAHERGVYSARLPFWRVGEIEKSHEEWQCSAIEIIFR